MEKRERIVPEPEVVPVTSAHIAVTQSPLTAEKLCAAEEEGNTDSGEY